MAITESKDRFLLKMSKKEKGILHRDISEENEVEADAAAVDMSSYPRETHGIYEAYLESEAALQADMDMGYSVEGYDEYGGPSYITSLEEK